METFHGHASANPPGSSAIAGLEDQSGQRIGGVSTKSRLVYCVLHLKRGSYAALGFQAFTSRS